ncbi:MAG TPA: methyltransferase [Candidatus Acidoferrales bacterium]|nr:methyltransferase [Candidatus Acidoferrales bacterium]
MKASDKRPAAQDVMLGHITGYWISQLIFVAARLGLADVLARGPLTVAALAKRVGAQASPLRRVLRALASIGVFAETADGRFKLTPLAATLRTDVPGSLRSFASMMVDGYNWDAWRELLHGVKTGDLPFNHVHGIPIFEFLHAHPELDREFSQSMASISGTENAAVARAYDFNRLGVLVDVGGAHGHLLGTILGRHRRLRGILYDQPQVVANAAASGFISAPGVAGRCTIQGGDFFHEVPRGAGAYLMKYIIHDWNDDQCVTILSNCRAAMAPAARVLVVEHVVRPGNAPDWSKMLDINMLVLPGGRERTREEFRALFQRAGLRLLRVHPTASALHILEAAPA